MCSCCLVCKSFALGCNTDRKGCDLVALLTTDAWCAQPPGCGPRWLPHPALPGMPQCGCIQCVRCMQCAHMTDSTSTPLISFRGAEWDLSPIYATNYRQNARESSGEFGCRPRLFAGMQYP